VLDDGNHTVTDSGGACADALGASSVLAWYCFTDYAWIEDISGHDGW
jgi:hypothetical protein